MFSAETAPGSGRNTGTEGTWEVEGQGEQPRGSLDLAGGSWEGRKGLAAGGREP